MSKLEEYEWLRIWYDHPEAEGEIRVLLIGDSITEGSRPRVQKYVDKNIRVDSIAGSRALDNERYKKEIMYVAESEEYKYIRINNGLHGFHLGIEDYEKAYDDIICTLKNRFPDAVIEIGTTTPATVDGKPEEFSDLNDIVLERNEAAKRLAAKYDVKLDDLYASVADKPYMRCGDFAHFNEEGWEYIGKHMAEHIMKLCERG